ncbi:MAG: hypothetical protein A2289_11470 [Deltaproteobacteria bacterium RIFOXYA12_FULL_58_15]|nr:MAG: hypothetical protein A2289_11470 [Deltaproteobacteria bacterium RIFOXYA12_FULL_58_15]
MVMRLRDYLLVERLAQGGMADVYLAKTFGFGGVNQEVAIKCIKPEIAEDRTFVRMFIDEAKLAVLLDHANIAQTYELGRIGTTYFMAMEYVAGRDLRAVIDRAQSRGIEIPEHLVLQIVSQVCDGLDYAHRKADPTGVPLNIVHRDVSPQNVLVSYTGEVKLIDFGIAKAANHASRTQAGVLKGKYGYMSPEQVLGGNVDARSDVFAAGVLFWEMLTRQRLFPGSSDFSVLEKVRHAEIMPPTLVVSGIHPDVEAVIMKSLERDPEDRIASGADMHDAVVAIMLSRFGHPSARELGTWMQGLFAEEMQESLDRLEKARQYSEMPADAEPMVAATVPGGKDETATVNERKVVDTTVEQIPQAPATLHEPAVLDNRAMAHRPRTPTKRPQKSRKEPSGADLTDDTPVEPMRLPSEEVNKSVAIGVAHPTEVRPSFPRPRRTRDLLIVLMAVLIAASLVASTWLWTRTTGAPGIGGAVVVSKPVGAQVMVDGVRVGQTPYSTSSLREGPHIITLELPGYQRTNRTIRVVADRVVELKVVLPTQ